MKIRTLGTLLGAAVLSGMMLLTACGGDDDAVATNTAAPVTGAGNVNTSTGQPTKAATPTAQPQQTDQPQSGLSINSCELITKEEAAAAISAAAVDEPVYSPFIGESFDQCVWRIQGGTDVDPALVVQVRQEGSSQDDYERLVDENCPIELGGPTAVSGVGDAAAECTVLVVKSGEIVFAVTVLSSVFGADESGIQKELAQKIIGRLP